MGNRSKINMLQVSWISAQQAQGVGRLRLGSDPTRSMLLPWRKASGKYSAAALVCAVSLGSLVLSIFQ